MKVKALIQRFVPNLDVVLKHGRRFSLYAEALSRRLRATKVGIGMRVKELIHRFVPNLDLRLSRRFFLYFAVAMAISWAIDRWPPNEQAAQITRDGVNTFRAYHRVSADVDQSLLSKVILVVLTEDDLRDKLQGRHPICRTALAKEIAWVLSQGPKAVFVDFSTEHPDYVGLHAEVRAVARDLSGKPDASAIVYWAQGVDFKNQIGALAPVLGGATITETNAVPGLVSARRDSDGRLRSLSVTPSSRQSLLTPRPMFLQAATELGLKVKPECETGTSTECTPDWLPYLTVSRIQQVPFSTLTPSIRLTAEKPFRDKVVFIGGSYSDEDRFVLANGEEYPGVEVLAAAALASAQGEFIPPALPSGLELVLKASGFIAITFALRCRNHTLGFLASWGTILVVCGVILVLTYTVGGLEVVPLCLGLLLDRWKDVAEGHAEHALPVSTTTKGLA